MFEFPQYFLDYQEKFDSKIRWSDRVVSSSGEWSGNIFDFFFKAATKLTSDIKRPFKLDGIFRVDDTPVHKAVREALVNTLVNADYYGRQGIVIQKYPESSIKPFALDVLLKANDMYNLGLNIESARPKDDREPEKESPYTFRPNDEYYVLVICNKKVRINPLKVRIGDFNKNNFRMQQLKVKNLMLNKEDALLTIDKFENVNKAIDYQTAMFLNDYVFGGIDKENYKVIIISVSNYPIFYQEKNVDEYLEFWHQYNK